MNNKTQFLYGDSTPSALVTDFIALLNKGLDCFVAILQAEQRMALGAARRRELELAAGDEVTRLHELEAAVSRTISASIAAVSPDGSVSRCSDAISRATNAAVAAAEAEIQAGLNAQILRIDESAAKERQRCTKALEQLVLEHELPGSDSELRLEHEAGGAYTARLHTTTPYGLVTTLALEIPGASLFCRPLRAGELVEGLEIQVPKTAGWIRKESRLAKEKLGRLMIAACAFGPRGHRISTRGDGADEGYDFACSADGVKVQASRISPAAPAEEFELVEEDARAIAGLVQKLAAAAAQPTPARKHLIAGQLDGEPLDSVRTPSTLVQRLVEVMAPTIREIAVRSGSAQELVLRRELGDGRREERFVRRAELLAKLSPLPAVHRGLFAPLELGEIPGTESTIQEISAEAVLELSPPPMRHNGPPPPQPPRTP
jgi:hypothetical protein